jgi:hypothetical protein
MRWMFWTGAALAVALDAGRPDALMLLSQCVSGGPLEAAWRAADVRHFSAFPWTTAWMLVLCLHGLPAAAGWPASRAFVRALAWRMAAMVAVMPVACMAGWLAASMAPESLAASSLPGLGMPSLALSGSAWPVQAAPALAYGAAMVLTCVALLHFLERLQAAGRPAPAQPADPAHSPRRFSC